MSDMRRKLCLLQQIVVGVFLGVGVLGVILFIVADHARPMLRRLIWESDPDGGRPPPEAFDRIRRQNEGIAGGVELVIWRSRKRAADIILYIAAASG